ncbi:hypothetical protein WN944_007919 [Citrus x changshan-huyou]|uniref:Uncharacterized protein n=1 Tax=Citrus x changshan-huyou TaxID=2935761 RepID=A0AAP0MLY2_9ROSI
MQIKRRPSGWKATPFILGNESFERVGSFGILASFTVYLLAEYNVSQVDAAVKFGAWNGVESHEVGLQMFGEKQKRAYEVKDSQSYSFALNIEFFIKRSMGCRFVVLVLSSHCC